VSAGGLSPPVALGKNGLEQPGQRHFLPYLGLVWRPEIRTRAHGPG
jgi:hypothetical protein